MKFSYTRLKWGALLLASSAIAPLAAAGNYPAYEPDLVPSGAVAGECYARVEIPPQYSMGQETVIIEDEFAKTEVEQPRLARRTEQVEVKEASVRYEVRQPTFKTMAKKIMVRPAYDKLSVTQPQFRNVIETIRTSAPRTVWKRGNPGALIAQGYTVLNTADAGRNGRGYGSTVQYGNSRSAATTCGDTCEIWCLVVESGESVSFNRKVMTSPGHVRRTPVPAKYTSITKQVVADPGGVREIPIPAQYRAITVEDVVSRGGTRTVNVPAKYGTVSKKTLASEGRYEWRRVVCDPSKGRGGISSSYSSSNGKGASSSATYGQGSYNSGTGGSYRSSGSGSVYRSGGVNSYRTGNSGVYRSGPSVSYGNGSYSGQTTHSNTVKNSSHAAEHQRKIYYYGTDKPVH